MVQLRLGAKLHFAGLADGALPSRRWTDAPEPVYARVMIRWIVVALLLCPAAAASADVPTGAAAQLRDCEALRGVRITRSEPVAGGALHAFDKANKRYLVFPRTEQRTCEAFPIGRAAGRVVAPLRSGGAKSKAFALTPSGCNLEHCPVAIVVRDAADERPLGALLLDDVACDRAVELSAVKAFPDHQSIIVTCRGDVGGGWHEQLVLVDAPSGEPRRLLDVDAGSFEALSPNEKAEGQCERYPVGFIRVEKAGERPTLRVLGPWDQEAFSEHGTLPAHQLVFDPKQRTFVAGGPDVATRVDPYRGCKPKD